MINPLILKPMKKLFFFLLFGWLLINFRPAAAQTSITMQENWNVALTAGEICKDVQVMNGYTYTLIYRGYWVNFDHYRVEKRNATGTVLASVNKDDVKSDINMLCYDNKVLLTSLINTSHVTGVKLYDNNLSLLKDTTWASPWTNSGQVRTKLFYYNNNVWTIKSALDGSSLSQKMKIEKLDPINLGGLNSIVIDSADFNGTLISYMGDTYKFFSEYGGYYYLNILKQDDPEISQRIKLNSSLQIVNIDPPSILALDIKIFNHGSFVYYLGANLTSADLYLVKKDANNFSNAWQVNLSWPVQFFSRNTNMFPTGNVFMFAPGDGTVKRIDPATGGIMGSATVTSIPQTADKSHHFYKINCAQDYPFMVVGPTATNPSEPFNIYLINPANLNTLSIKNLSGINPDYKIREAGDKIYVIGNRIVELSVLVWPSLKIIAGASGQDITNGSSTISLNTSAPPEVIFNANADSFWVKNISGTPKAVKCKKIVLNQVNGSSNFFSWDVPYSPSVYVSNAVNISSDSSFKNFSSHYLWNNLTGSTKIRYVFFDSSNVNDSVWYDITYDITAAAWPSLKIIAGASGQDITNGSSTISLNTSAPPEVIFNANADSFWVKNISGTPKAVKCKKIVLNQVNGSSNFFSWDVPYSPSVYVSNAVNISSDSSFKNFSSHYLWNNLTGSTKIRYVFFDSSNVNDSVWYDITYDITVGIPDNPKDQIRIFPNPAQDQLYIQGLSQAEFTIYKLTGEVVMKSWNNCLNVSELSPGLYCLEIKTENQQTTVHKFLKQ